jgi:hypothetical protein
LNQEKRKPVLLVENWLGFSIICIDAVWRYAGSYYAGSYYAGVSPEFTKKAPTFLNE